MSPRNLPFRNLAEFLRRARKIDDVDRIEGRRLFELVVDRHKNSARGRGLVFYTKVDIGALDGRAGRAGAEQKDA